MHSIPLYKKHIKIYVCIFPSRTFKFYLIYLYVCPWAHVQTFLQSIYLKVELLSHGVSTSSYLIVITKRIVPNSTSSVWWFLFLHMFCNSIFSRLIFPSLMWVKLHMTLYLICISISILVSFNFFQVFRFHYQKSLVHSFLLFMLSVGFEKIFSQTVIWLFLLFFFLFI